MREEDSVDTHDRLCVALHTVKKDCIVLGGFRSKVSSKDTPKSPSDWLDHKLTRLVREPPEILAWF